MKRLSLLALVALAAAGVSPVMAEMRLLFPQPLHLTREIDDPLAGRTFTVDEYCSGNRVVSISGDRTSITDYDKQEMVSIDRAAGTYSVVRFSDLVAADREIAQSAGAATSEKKRAPWKATPMGVRSSRYGRSVMQFQFERDDAAGSHRVEVGVDRGVPLSREAVEVLVGAAFPNTRREEHEVLLRAAGAAEPSGVLATSESSAPASNSAADVYGLPVTQLLTYSDGDAVVTLRSTVTRVGSEPPPPQSMIIPPGAKLVESRTLAMRRQLRELDLTPVPQSQR
jgi:hypothetical protein